MENTDKETAVFKAELDRLKRVFEKASDLHKCYCWPGFLDVVISTEQAQNELFDAVVELEQWYSEGTEE